MLIGHSLNQKKKNFSRIFCIYNTQPFVFTFCEPIQLDIINNKNKNVYFSEAIISIVAIDTHSKYCRPHLRHHNRNAVINLVDDS